jgi:hypothetical protein
MQSCGKAGFGHFSSHFSSYRTTMFLKMAQKLPQTGLCLATNAQVRQAASALWDWAAQKKPRYKPGLESASLKA